jgi:hypothetical protein
MSDESISILFDRIRVLLQEQSAAEEADADAVEHTLTDGYARALALDGERLRTEQEIHRLAGSDEHVGQVRILKARLRLLEEELVQLRGLLGTLAARRHGQRLVRPS